jgi:hypothetical protein
MLEKFCVWRKSPWKNRLPVKVKGESVGLCGLDHIKRKKRGISPKAIDKSPRMYHNAK